jgi:hypothetical protein
VPTIDLKSQDLTQSLELSIGWIIFLYKN